ncbi:MAG TPA: AMP-binding protein, partial [Sphingobacteriaceae bacterium]
MSTVTRIFDLLAHSQQYFRKDDMIAGKAGGGWKKYSTDSFINIVDQVSRGLLAMGIKPGDRVAIMSPNRPEWNICDFAIMQIGAGQVPMYPSLAESDTRFILEDAEVKMIFVDDRPLYDKISKIKAECAYNVSIFTFNQLEGADHWKQLAELGRQHEDIDL